MIFRSLSGLIIPSLVLISLLCVVTFLLSQLTNRYDYSGGDLLGGDNLDESLDGWSVDVAGGSIFINPGHGVEIKLTNKNKAVYIRRDIPIDLGNRYLRFAGSIKTEQLEVGSMRWQIGHMLVIGLDSDGKKLWDSPHYFVKNSDYEGWEYHSTILELDERAKSIRINFQMTEARGSMSIKGLSLQPVTENTGVRWVRIMLSGAWFALIGCLVLVYLMHSSWGAKEIAFGSFLVLLFVMMVVPIDSVFPYIRLIEPVLDPENISLLSTLFHLLVFFVLSRFAYGSISTLGQLVLMTSFLVVLALATEILQLLVDERNAEVSDFIADIIGIMAALMWQLWAVVRCAKKKSSQTVGSGL